jgi:metal-sulfur cluster biosynthetic enzyme
VQPDDLDQRLDLWLRALQEDRAPVGSEAPREHRQVEHQRRIGEHQLGEVDNDVGLCLDRSGQRLAPTSLRCAVLVAAAAQGWRLVVEIDDGAATYRKMGRSRKVGWTFSYTQSMVTAENVTDALRDVIDPELGLDFVELGLIYEVEVDGGNVHVTFTLTSPGCPIGPQVSEQIDEFVGELDGVEQVSSTMVFSPPWSPERMSEDAKFALGF